MVVSTVLDHAFTGIAQKIKFFIKDFFSKCDQIRRKPADLVTFTEEILYGKLHLFVQCGGNLELIGADTDFLIMFVMFWNSIMGEIIMKFKTTKEHRAMEPDTDNIVGFIGDARKYLTLAPAFRR